MPHQLHGDGGGHASSLLESPREVQQPSSERRLQHNEHGAEGAEPRRVRMRRGAGQQADALPGEFLHGSRSGWLSRKVLLRCGTCFSRVNLWRRTAASIAWGHVRPGALRHWVVHLSPRWACLSTPPCERVHKCSFHCLLRVRPGWLQLAGY